MAERAMVLQRIREGQIRELDEFLVSAAGARRLTEAELGRQGNKLAGWSTEIDAGGKAFLVRILLERHFPLHPPTIVLEDSSFHLTYPHVEKSGKLCLAPSPTSFSPARPVETMQFLLDQARDLLAKSVKGENRDDFIAEFRSYWPGRLSELSLPFWSVLDAKETTRLVHYWRGEKFAVFAESQDACRSWVKNFYGGSAPSVSDVKSSVFVWLKKPLLPGDYPATGAAFRRLAKESEAEVDTLFAQLVAGAPSSLPVMFGFSTESGPVFGGLMLTEPKAANLRGKSTRNCKSDGFRPGKVPADVLLNRYFGASSAAGATVARADSAWIHARGGTGASSFADKHVGIFGCGSVGAEVAFLLAKSGVGNFHLVDNQILSLDNVGRHLLGASYVGQHKSDALETFLKKQLPGLQAKTSGARSIEDILLESPSLFEELDLVISTTGDWPSDCALNIAASEWRRFPPVLFGWLEPFAIAGHALLVNGRGGCLACGMSEFGSFEHRVVEWKEPDKTMVRATGCGDFFQPYSVTNAAPTKTLIADYALEVLQGTVAHPEWRTWVGEMSRLSTLGGQLRQPWISRLTLTPHGKAVFNAAWGRNPQCPFCD